MHPILAFTLVELFILIAILLILAVLFGPAIADAIGKAKKATGGQKPVTSWTTAPTSVPVNTPTEFVFSLLFQKLDAKGAPTGAAQPGPENSPAFFDLKMIKGNGRVVSATIDGNALPQAKDATPGSPAVNIAGATDTYGVIRVVVQLEEGAQAQLIAHESPDASLKGWTESPIAFSSP